MLNYSISYTYIFLQILCLQLMKKKSSLSVISFDIQTVILLLVVSPVMCEFEFNKWLFEDTAPLIPALCKELIKECINEALSDFPK